jgi:DNA-binding FadR family transcriptional regulator
MTNKRKYSNCDSVYKNLQNYFAKKNFDTSERVPSERQIAVELGVNRTTLRTAMQRMVKEGLLERQVGVGTFFRISPREMAENYTKINTKCTYSEILEARIILEPKLAQLAALEIGEKDFIILKQFSIPAKNATGRMIAELDINFHDALANIASNMMLKQMYQVISNLRKKIMAANPDDTIYESYECVGTWLEHQNNIISALENKEPRAAYNAVKEKLNCIFGQYSIVKH